MKKFLLGLVATALAATTGFAQQNELAHGNTQAPIVIHRLHGAPPQAASTGSGTTGNGINYNGGPVMNTGVNMYYIFYGNWSGYPLANGILTNFANNIGGSRSEEHTSELQSH